MSYARVDDEHDGGYLTMLRRRLEGELLVQSGEQIAVFQDREDILWGQAWRQRISAGLEASVVLLPILTPGFLRSAACRKEFEQFLKRESRLNRNDLILPLYYVSSPLIESPSASPDPIVSALAERQRYDWRENRFKELENGDVRRDVAALATGILAAMDRGEVHGTADLVADDPWTKDEAPGLVERIAEAHAALETLPVTVSAMTQLMDEIGAAAQRSTSAIERADETGSPPGARVAIIGRYRGEIQPLVDKYDALSADYSELILRIDAGLNDLIRAASEAVVPEDQQKAIEFLEIIGGMADSSVTAIESIDGFRSIVESQLSLSSTLRPVLRRLINALGRIIRTKPIFDAWKERASDGLQQLSGTVRSS